MAVRQPYRGNPTTKETVLYNNFSGGINTTDVDSRLYTNQFRELVNVELVEQGAIQNRKGFGHADIIMSILETANVPLDNLHKVYAFKVLSDVDNVLDRMADFELNKESGVTPARQFLDYYSNKFELLLFSVFSTVENVLQYMHIHIEATRTANSDPLEIVGNYNQSLIGDLEEVEVRTSNLTGISTVEYNSKVYFNLSEISPQMDRILVVEFTDDLSNVPSITYISNTDYYTPTPYEATNVGFNMMSGNPLAVSYAGGTSLKTIRAIYLTDRDNPLIKLDKIPENNDFRLNVIHTGLTKENIIENLYFYTIDETKIYADKSEYKLKHEITYLEGENTGTLTFSIRLTVEDSQRPIYIKYLHERTIPAGEVVPEGEIKATFATVDDMLSGLSIHDKWAYTEFLENGIKKGKLYKGNNFIMEQVSSKALVKPLTGTYYKIDSLQNKFTYSTYTSVSDDSIYRLRPVTGTPPFKGTANYSVGRAPYEEGMRFGGGDLSYYDYGGFSVFSNSNLNNSTSGQTITQGGVLANFWSISLDESIEYLEVYQEYVSPIGWVKVYPERDSSGALSSSKKHRFYKTVSGQKIPEFGKSTYLMINNAIYICDINNIRFKFRDSSYPGIAYTAVNNPTINISANTLSAVPIYDTSTLPNRPDLFKQDFYNNGFFPAIYDNGTRSFVAVNAVRYDGMPVYTNANAYLSNLELYADRGAIRPEEIGLPTLVKDGEIYTQDFIKTTQQGLNDMSPVRDKFYKVGDGDTARFFQYSGGNAGTISDFVEYLPTEEDLTIIELQYITSYEVGNTQDLKPISAIKLINFGMIEIQDRLCIYSGNTLMFSHLYKFDYFPNNNYVVLPIANDDEITKVAYYRGSYMIFSKSTVWRMSGTFGDGDFSISLVSNEIGCISSDSVKAINNTLVFLSTDGLYVLKQNYYMEGLENVEKVDKQIYKLIPIRDNVESMLYNEQLLLFTKEADGTYKNTVKQYYNMAFEKNGFPYVTDVYKTKPDNLFKMGRHIYSIKSGRMYMYDRGYTDFMPPESDNHNLYMYRMTIKTPNYTIGYPVHNKKFKNVFIKTQTDKVVPVSITVAVDGNDWIEPDRLEAVMTPTGEIEYKIVSTPNLKTRHARLAENPTDVMRTTVSDANVFGTVYYDYDEEIFITPVYNVDDFELGKDILGERPYQTHKILVGGKGKTISFKIEQELNEKFSIHDLLIVFKLGKVKEG